MKDPRFPHKLVWLVAAALFAVPGPGFAQPPERNTARQKPQVIYHLPPSSSSAARLHSQAKGQNSDRPVDSDGPAAPQVSRENPNMSTAQAREQSVTAPPAEAPQQQIRPQRLKREKSQSVRVARPHPGKGKGPGGPKKSHKK